MKHDGYRIAPELISPALIAEARVSVEELCATLHPGDPRWEKHVFPLSKLKPQQNPGINPAEVTAEPYLLSDLPPLSPALNALTEAPALLAFAREILETDEIVRHFSNVTRKAAKVGPNLAWHRDYPNGYICPKASADFFRVLIPLERMDEENGCTLAIPQSHLLSDEEALLKPKEADYATSIPLIAEAGSAIAIHPKLLHGGNENRSGRHRNLVVIQFGRRTGEFLHCLNVEELRAFS